MQLTRQPLLDFVLPLNTTWFQISYGAYQPIFISFFFFFHLADEVSVQYTYRTCQLMLIHGVITTGAY